MRVPIYGIFTGTLAVLLLLSIPFPLHAFRCGDGLVTIGDSKGRVLIECGKPTFKEKVGDKEARKIRNRDEDKGRQIFQDRGAVDL